MEDSERIQDEIDKAEESTVTGTSKWPGMTYEQGVSAALRWAIGESDDAPMADE